MDDAYIDEPTEEQESETMQNPPASIPEPVTDDTEPEIVEAAPEVNEAVMQDEPPESNEALPDDTQKKKSKIERSEFGHRLSHGSGCVDEVLATGASVTNQDIADAWNGDGKRFMTKGMINGHVQHLIKEHNAEIEIEDLGKGIKRFTMKKSEGA